MIRRPVVAGQFYPAAPGSLIKQIEGMLDKKAKKEDALGIVSPHAGYIYSGPVAAAVFSRIKPKKNYIILGPNHTGYGRQFSIMTQGSWKMPQGEVAINEKLAKKLLSGSKYLEEDTSAHLYEHSIEVQLPFLQYLGEDFQFVPIVVTDADAEAFKELGKEMAEVIKDSKEDVTIIASSDMTHYEPHEEAKAKDKKAIEAMLALDADELLARVHKFNISMCGYAPCAVMLSMAKELGAKRAELVKYQTSGDTSGDYSAVVGYAGIIIKNSV